MILFSKVAGVQTDELYRYPQPERPISSTKNPSLYENQGQGVCEHTDSFSLRSGKGEVMWRQVEVECLPDLLSNFPGLL